MPALPKLLNLKPHVETRIFRALDEARAKEADGAPRLLRLSSVGDCPRALWAALHGVPEDTPPEGRILIVFKHGNAIEAHVIELLRAAGFLVSDRDQAGGQHRIEAYGGRVRGHIDGKILLGSKVEREHLLEIKSAKVERFEECQRVGYEAWNERYADTLHAYMGLGGFTRALVVVYCKDDSRMHVESIAFDPDRWTRLRLKIEYVLAAESGPVARPEEAASQYCSFCKWCSRNEWCWGPLAETRFDD